MSLSPAPVPTNTVYSTNWLDINPVDMLKKVKEVLYAVERFSAYRRETSSIKQKNAAFSLILLACSSKLWLLEPRPNMKDIVNTYADPVSVLASTMPVCPAPYLPCSLRGSPVVLPSESLFPSTTTEVQSVPAELQQSPVPSDTQSDLQSAVSADPQPDLLDHQSSIFTDTQSDLQMVISTDPQQDP
eukprot:superscaffoldBa00000899_g7895